MCNEFQKQHLALVANGVTAVCDLGGDPSEIDLCRKEIAAGSRVGLLIVRAGPMLVGQDRCASKS
jgi:hypothetical protein